MPEARRFTRASACGGTLATFVFCWMITNARFDFFATEPFGAIQDAQARSLFHGRWDVPASTVGFEGFLVHGKYYTYFGPFLALVRMPVLAVTNRLDGRLTIVSMLIALVVLLVAASHVHWQVRCVVRGERPLGPAEAFAVGAFTFLVGAGSIVAFLSSRALVYHEVELWGIAWAVAATDAIVAFARRPSRARTRSRPARRPSPPCSRGSRSVSRRSSRSRSWRSRKSSGGCARTRTRPGARAARSRPRRGGSLPHHRARRVRARRGFALRGREHGAVRIALPATARQAGVHATQTRCGGRCSRATAGASSASSTSRPMCSSTHDPTRCGSRATSRGSRSRPAPG